MSAIVDRLADDTLAYAIAYANRALLGGDWAEVADATDRVNDGLIAVTHWSRARRSGAAHELEFYGGER